MNISKKYFIGIVVLLPWALYAQTQKYFDFKKAHQNYSTEASLRSIRQGFTMKLWMSNDGRFGYTGNIDQFSTPSLEYPVGSGIEHLFGGGLMVGAAVTDSSRPDSIQHYISVTQVYNLNSGGSDTKGVDTVFWQTSTDTMSGTNRRFYDDDGDGRIDEDPLDGIDNDGDGKIDEDYGAVSENDLSIAYADTFAFRFNFNPDHKPLGIKVLQRSLAWKNRVKEPILPIEFTIVNIGKKTLKGVYLGFNCDFDVGPWNVIDYYQDNYVGYYPELHTVYVSNPHDRPSTPIGLTLLSASRPLNGLNYVLCWFFPGFEVGDTRDSLLYELMTCGYSPESSCTSPDGSPTNLGDAKTLFSFGPFGTLKPGDSVKAAIAFVSGEYLDIEPNSLRGNAAKAIKLGKRNFTPVPVPASPPLIVTRENNKFILNWEWKPGDPGTNPLDSWDDYHESIGSLPDTNWRRRNPPPGHTAGGRNFAGFKVWRSVSQTRNDSNFTLLAQYNTDDDPSLGYHLGLHYSFVDSNLRVGNYYSYTVTSYSFPESDQVSHYDSSRNATVYDTVYSNIVESNIYDNAKYLHLSFGPSTKLGEVKVVPNPYRGDIYYTDGNGFEGDELTWYPERRVVWFTHLPAHAIIRIYTIAGDVIATINHDDASRISNGSPVGQEEWKLFSESGLPVSSGMYIFSVESEYGQQVGKFVIIL